MQNHPGVDSVVLGKLKSPPAPPPLHTHTPSWDHGPRQYFFGDNSALNIFNQPPNVYCRSALFFFFFFPLDMYKDPQKPRLYRNRYRQAIHGLAAFLLPLYRPSRQDRGASSQPTPLICISRGVIGPRRAAIGAATDPADVSWTTPACDDRAPCNPTPPPPSPQALDDGRKSQGVCVAGEVSVDPNCVTNTRTLQPHAFPNAGPRKSEGGGC